MIAPKDLADGGLDPYEETPVSEPGEHSRDSRDSRDGFGPLRPFGSTGELPSFPVEALPEPWSAYVSAVACSYQVSVDMPAMVLLGVLATALQGRFRVRGKPGHYEPLCLWPVIVAEPASRKSAVLSRLLAPVLEWEKAEAEHCRPIQSEALAQREALSKAIERARKRTVAPTVTEEDRAELARLVAELDAVPQPFAIPALVGADATPEVIGVLLSEQGRFTLASAEGDEVFAIAAGRYSESSNLDMFLKGHAGDSHRVHRISRDPLDIREAVLSLALMIQPSVLRARATHETRGRGFLGRILYAIPPSCLGERGYETPDVPGPLEEAYQAGVSALLSLSVQRFADGRWDTRLIDLSPEAFRVCARWFSEIEPDLGESGRFESLRDWAGKLHGATLRIAALLHAAERPILDPSSRPVSAETFERAIRIARYLIPHAEAAFDSMGACESEDEVRARRVLRWIREGGPRSNNPKNPSNQRGGEHSRDSRDCWDGVSFTESQVQQALRRSFDNDASLIRPALDVLAERNYIALVPESHRPGPGRKPSPRWCVNPALGEAFRSG